MKTLRKLCAVVTLIFALSLPALAGDITTMVVPPPPPPSASAKATEPRDVDSGEIQGAVESESLITELTLTIMQLLSVF